MKYLMLSILVLHVLLCLSLVPLASKAVKIKV